MRSSDEKAVVDDLKRHLDQRANNLDELTSARLGAMRRRALGPKARPLAAWLPAGGLGAAAAVLIAVAVWTMAPQTPRGFPGDLALLTQVEDLELIEELEFYVWLEENEPRG